MFHNAFRKSSCVVAAMVATFVAVASLSAQPYWASLDGPVMYKRADEAHPAADVRGKRFIFIPKLKKETLPRYDYRLLLSFEDDHLVERGVGIDAKHPIVWDGQRFHFASTTPGVSGELSRLLGQGSGAQFYMRDSGIVQSLRKHIELGRAVWGIHLGHLWQVDEKDFERFAAHLAEAEKAEQARREQERGSAQPLDYVETHQLRDGATFEHIYFGRFDQLREKIAHGPDGGESDIDRISNDLAAQSRLQMLFCIYHEVYGKKYGATPKMRASSGEPWAQIQTETVLRTRDGWGNLVGEEKSTGPVGYVQADYAGAFVQAQPGAVQVFMNVARYFDPQTQTIDPMGLINEWGGFVESSRRFLQRYKQTSPATIEHFERNLLRAISGQEPLSLAEADFQPLSNPDVLPWAQPEAGGGVEWVSESSMDPPVQWRRPAAWKKKSPRGAIVKFSTMPAADGSQRVAINIPLDVWIAIADRSYDDEAMLKAVNFWKDKDDLDYEHWESLDQANLEEMKVDGRRTRYITYRRYILAYISDGPRTFVVGMTGHPVTVDENRANFRQFVESIDIAD